MRLAYTKPERIILSAVRQYKDFIAPTYGPAGKKVLIIDGEFSHKAVDDGKLASEAFEIRDEAENAVVQYIKETTAKIHKRAKDGTTTGALIMAAIIEEGFKNIESELHELDANALAIELEKGLHEAVKKIEGSAKQIKTKDELYVIAKNAFNNEPIAKLIADTVHKIGKDGVIAIEDSQTMTTSCDIVQGLEVNRGYASQYLLNPKEDKDKDKTEDAVILTHPAILLVNKKLDLFGEVVNVVKLAIQDKKQIAIIADGFGEGFINSIIVERFRSNGQFSPILVETPGFGAEKLINLKDIAIVVGAKVVDDKLLTLDKVALADLGSADSVKSTKDKTIILGGKGKKADVEAYVEKLRQPNDNKFEAEKNLKRAASIQGGIAVIKIGAYTENDQKSLKPKVENAVSATQLAFKEGVIPGAGKTLSSLKTSSDVLNVALKAPRAQLELNGAKYLDENSQDPVAVLIAGLETGVSVAIGLLTLGGISAPKRKYDEHGNPL